MRLGLAAAAITFAAAFVLLGQWVIHQPPTPLDVAGATWHGAATPLAIVLTNSGYGVVVGTLGTLGVLGALALRAPLKIPLLIFALEIVSQGFVALVKLGFARPRPQAWLYVQEPGYSYPSGHAATAMVFYGAWLLAMWFAPLHLTVRVAGVVLLAGWIAGIGWSRVALGAHNPTDVIGGYLFGLVWLCALFAVVGPRALASPKPRGQ